MLIKYIFKKLNYFKVDNYLKYFAELKQFRTSTIRPTIDKNTSDFTTFTLIALHTFPVFFFTFLASHYFNNLFGFLLFVLSAIFVFYSMHYQMHYVENKLRKEFKKLLENEDFISFIKENYFYILKLDLKKKESISFLKDWQNTENPLYKRMNKIKKKDLERTVISYERKIKDLKERIKEL